jgi:cytochrome c-type biogenesis protein CcmE
MSLRKMKSLSNALRIGIAVAIVVGTIGWLAYSGYGSNKSYDVTIGEMEGMGNRAYTSNLRLQEFVKLGSIVRNGPDITFLMDEFESHSAKAATGRMLKVVYKGSEPPPDNFKDDPQTLAIGTYGRDGVFHAMELQAKCASSYAPAQPIATPAKTALPRASHAFVAHRTAWGWPIDQSLQPNARCYLDTLRISSRVFRRARFLYCNTLLRSRAAFER